MLYPPVVHYIYVCVYVFGGVCVQKQGMSELRIEKKYPATAQAQIVSRDAKNIKCDLHTTSKERPHPRQLRMDVSINTRKVCAK